MDSAAVPNQLRVVEQSWVSPPPGSVADDAVLPLTSFDVFWLKAGVTAECLFFYSSPATTDHFVLHRLPALKSSLSVALHRFFPLSGRLRGLTISYVQGDSVPLTFSESDADFHHLSGRLPRASTELRPLVPVLPASTDTTTRPLFAAQVTVFPRSGGICLGVAFDHVACDGSISVQFLKYWAAASKSGGEAATTTAAPLYDRTLILSQDINHGDYDNKIAKKPKTLHDSSTAVFYASFLLAKEKVERLKREASAASDAAPFHCSTFVVACAYAWVCLLKARGGGGGRAHFAFLADCRGRLRPPVPPEYFGNCAWPCFLEADVDGIATAAEAIGRAVGGLREGQLRELPDSLPEGLVSVAGSPKLGAYGVDFGWGRPVNVEQIFEKAGTISLAESRDDQGGIQIGLPLPKHQMDEFQAHFHRGLSQQIL